MILNIIIIIIQLLSYIIQFSVIYNKQVTIEDSFEIYFSVFFTMVSKSFPSQFVSFSSLYLYQAS